MLENEAKALLKTLSMMLAEKWQKPYSVVAGIVRSKIGIAIVRATNQYLRSPCIGFRSMSKRIDWNWDDGGGTNLYRISNQHFKLYSTTPLNLYSHYLNPHCNSLAIPALFNMSSNTHPTNPPSHTITHTNLHQLNTPTQDNHLDSHTLLLLLH